MKDEVPTGQAASAPQGTNADGHRFRPWEIGPTALVLIGLFVWSRFTIRHTDSLDVGLAYRAGVEAWRTGQPEALATWIGTPFLAFLMAVVSRLFSISAVVRGLDILNIALLAGVFSVLWKRFRLRVSRGWWWLTLFLSLSFAPISSSVWWKQFNILALGAAFFSFKLMRDKPERIGPPAFLAALSLAIKPICILLPIALTLRRETRKVGMLAIAITAGLIAAGQSFLAFRSGDISDLVPIDFLKAFSARMSPANVWVCHTENFSPQSLLCRLIGDHYWGAQRLVVGVAVLVMIAFAAGSIKQRPAHDWAVFAFACLLSPMVGPIAWSHYQVMLLPMLLLLAHEFRRGALWWLWTGLFISYGLAQLVWQPFGTLPGAGLELITDIQQSRLLTFSVMSTSMFAQYFVLMTALIWFSRQEAGVPKGDESN